MTWTRLPLWFLLLKVHVQLTAHRKLVANLWNLQWGHQGDCFILSYWGQWRRHRVGLAQQSLIEITDFIHWTDSPKWGKAEWGQAIVMSGVGTQNQTFLWLKIEFYVWEQYFSCQSVLGKHYLWVVNIDCVGFIDIGGKKQIPFAKKINLKHRRHL